MNRQLSRKHLLGTLGALGTFGVPRIARAADGETYTLRLSIPTGVMSVQGLAALRFAQAVGRRSNGQLKIEVYPTGQLAKELASIDGLSTGLVDLTIQASGFLEPLFPNYQAFDLPFLFKDFAAGLRVLDGPVGAEFFAELETKGILGLGWGSSGFRQLETTSKAVMIPDDLKGLRIRVQSGTVFVATYQALGANPVTIDATEIPAALFQHTIDGLDISLDAFLSDKYFTVVKHVAMSNHVMAILPLLASKRRLEALPPALQKIIREEGKAVIPYMRSIASQRQGAAIATLKSNGVLFSEIQFAPFRKAMEPVYATLQAKIGGNLIERIARAGS